MSTKTEIAISSPPIAVAGASFLGYSLPEWAAIVTIVYTMFLMARMALNEWRDWKERK